MIRLMLTIIDKNVLIENNSMNHVTYDNKNLPFPGQIIFRSTQNI